MENQSFKILLVQMYHSPGEHMKNDLFKSSNSFRTSFCKESSITQENLINYLYVHDCTLASECIWVSSPRTHLRNTAGQAMIIRGSGRSLINMSRSDIPCHDKGAISKPIIKPQRKIASKNLIFLQNFNSD